MTFIFRSHTVRTMAVGALTSALVSTGTAAAHAATSSPGYDLSTTTAAVQRASITSQASPNSVKPGDEVRFTGRSTGLRVGEKVTLQQKENGKWKTLPINTTVKKGDSYSVSTRPTAKGTQHYRVMSGSTHSPSVTVTVK
jgi:plastocyanin